TQSGTQQRWAQFSGYQYRGSEPSLVQAAARSAVVRVETSSSRSNLGRPLCLDCEACHLR
ncbi:hypothetical protein, partial [Streptomyces sp. NPDC056405]|uniref:hypothetical protein n=1 Tax=Streptomyces sp. NPDC056405 TaxID=3345811 RepID=UPI0035DF700C